MPINNKKSNLVDLNKSYKIILKPLVTEKATKLSEFNKVVFAVSLKSNKIEIKGSRVFLEEKITLKKLL